MSQYFGTERVVWSGRMQTPQLQVSLYKEATQIGKVALRGQMYWGHAVAKTAKSHEINCCLPTNNSAEYYIHMVQDTPTKSLQTYVIEYCRRDRSKKN